MTQDPKYPKEAPFTRILEDGAGTVTITTEMETVGGETSPTGNFIINLNHISGEYRFTIGFDKDAKWEAHEFPESLDPGLIDWIGGAIEDHYE